MPSRKLPPSLGVELRGTQGARKPRDGYRQRKVPSDPNKQPFVQEGLKALAWVANRHKDEKLLLADIEKLAVNGIIEMDIATFNRSVLVLKDAAIKGTIHTAVISPPPDGGGLKKGQSLVCRFAQDKTFARPDIQNKIIITPKWNAPIKPLLNDASDYMFTVQRLGQGPIVILLTKVHQMPLAYFEIGERSKPPMRPKTGWPISSYEDFVEQKKAKKTPSRGGGFITKTDFNKVSWTGREPLVIKKLNEAKTPLPIVFRIFTRPKKSPSDKQNPLTPSRVFIAPEMLEHFEAKDKPGYNDGAKLSGIESVGKAWPHDSPISAKEQIRRADLIKIWKTKTKLVQLIESGPVRVVDHDGQTLAFLAPKDYEPT